MLIELDALRTSTTAVSLLGGWTLHRQGWQFLRQPGAAACSASGALLEAAGATKWSIGSLGILRPETARFPNFLAVAG
jgi:hypothetical protein